MQFECSPSWRKRRKEKKSLTFSFSSFLPLRTCGEGERGKGRGRGGSPFLQACMNFVLAPGLARGVAGGDGWEGGKPWWGVGRVVGQEGSMSCRGGRRMLT